MQKYVKIWLNILKSCDSNNDDNSELKRRCQLHICGINFYLSQVKNEKSILLIQSSLLLPITTILITFQFVIITAAV